MRSLLLIFLFSLLLASCKKFTEAPEKKCFIPYVDFVAQHVDPATLEVTFSAVTSYNGTISSYKWDFGDGTTFNGQDPAPHKYPSVNGAAHYKVKLTVANDCGEAYWTQDVTISACLPDTKFTFRYLNDSTVEFTNQTKTSSNTSYVWNFGDGSTGTNSQSTFTHVYQEDKPFVVSLKATNACGDNNYTETISVCRKPEASQNVSINSCGAVTIDASGSKNAIKFQWDLGNGTIMPTTPTTSPTLNYTYPNAGNYTITLKVFNAAGCDSATTTNKVSVAASALATNSNWNYTSDDLDFVFRREAIANAVSYKWDFGDGTTSTAQNPSHTYSNPGAYTVKLSATGSCGSSYEFSADVNAPYYNTLKNLPEAGFQQVVAFSPSLIYYLGTSGKLYRTDTSGNWTAINLPNGLVFNNDTKLYVDESNTLWIYGRKDVERLNTNGTSWTSYFSKTGLPNNATIDALAVDNNGEVWTISGGVLRKGNTVIHSSVSFSSLAFAAGTNRIWLTSQNSAGLYYINTNSTQLNPVSNTSITGGGDQIQIASNGDIFVTTSTGIVRMNSSGTTTSTYNSSTTNGLISARPTAYDFDSQGNMWVLLSGELYKVPLANSANSKKYSYNADLSNVSSLSVLNLSGTDSDILLAKTSGNAAIKIR